MGTIHHPLALNRESQEDEIFIVMSKLYLFSYLIDGRYDIDNSIAERFIRVNARTRCSLLAAAWQMYRSLPYAALNMPNERAVCSGISQEILPRNCQREKGL